MTSLTQTRRSAASAPGTCGELAQGLLDGVLCMITCPVDLMSVVSVELFPGDGSVSGPPDSPKTALAVKKTLEFLGETGSNAQVTVESPLPRGKGMASSTADVAAAIAATAASAGQVLTSGQIASLALGVEPSDGVMFPGIVAFDHRGGTLIRPLGHPPPMRVVALDFGGEVDTLDFNSTDRQGALVGQAPRMAEAAGLIEGGIRQGSPELIGRGASISSRANQEILPNPNLGAVMRLAQEADAVGVNVAHSGTVIGMLFPDDILRAEEAMALARERFGNLEASISCRLIGGGVSLL